MKIRNQKGFSAVEFLLVIVVLLALGVIGYFVYDRMQDNKAKEDNQSTSQSTDSETQTAPEIDSTGDLDEAQAVLDQTNLDSSNTSDTTQLDSQLNSF